MSLEKILVTGAAGFIGSNLCSALLEKRHAVCAVDNLSQSTTRNIERHFGSPGFEFVQEDVRNEEAIRRLAQDAWIIVHLAAFKIPRYGNALDTLTINVHGTESVLKAAKERKSRVVFASTSDVYGRNPHLPFAETHDLYLGETNVKRWAYAVSKIMDEHYAFAYQQEYDVPVTALRFFGGYGPGQNTTWWGGPQSVFIDSALRDQPMEIHGPMPSVNTTGSPGTVHSMATTSSREAGDRSLVWATHRWPSAVAGGPATRSEQRPSTTTPAVTCDGRTDQISSIEAANRSWASTPAPSAAPSISATSQGVAASVAAR